MGKPLVVSVYHIITEDPAVDIQELSKLKSCPSQFIMDNRFYYGEYEIIGNAPLPEIVDYPIMYGQSISGTDRNKIIFQMGKFYNEIPLEGNDLVGGLDFKNNGMNCALHIHNRNILEACIEEDSNGPYWFHQKEGFTHDIRNPKYKDELAKVMEQMGIVVKHD